MTRKAVEFTMNPSDEPFIEEIISTESYGKDDILITTYNSMENRYNYYPLFWILNSKTAKIINLDDDE